MFAYLSNIYTSPSLWFSNPMISRMKSVKHFSFQQHFFFKVCGYKDFKTKLPLVSF